MISKKILFVITLFISTISQGQKITGQLSPIFDISPDGKSLVLSISNGESSALYIYTFIDDKLIPLTDTKGYYIRPVYSPKGDKIIFLSRDLKSETNDLCVIDLDSKKIKRLTNGQVYVLEASFLKGGAEIIYCVVGTTTAHPTTAKKIRRDLDLYLMDQDGNDAKKVTDFHAHMISGIAPDQQGDKILCGLMFEGGDGIYLISLSDKELTKLEAVNNPRPEIGSEFYGTPAFSNDNRLISFTSPYQLYTMNMADKRCEEIWSTFGKEEQAMPVFSRFYETDKKIVFSALVIVDRQYSRSAEIYSVDLITKKTTPINIPLSK